MIVSRRPHTEHTNTLVQSPLCNNFHRPCTTGATSAAERILTVSAHPSIPCCRSPVSYFASRIRLLYNFSRSMYSEIFIFPPIQQFSAHRAFFSSLFFYHQPQLPLAMWAVRYMPPAEAATKLPFLIAVKRLFCLRHCQPSCSMLQQLVLLYWTLLSHHSTHTGHRRGTRQGCPGTGHQM